MNIENQQLYREFINREEGILHAPFQPEFEFYQSIKNGDLQAVRALCQEKLHEKKGLGTLSSNSIQNMKYHFAITTALVTRYCVEGGMDFVEAYSLSDHYIFSADQCNSIEEISVLHQSMCLDYTNRMSKIHKTAIHSKPVSSAIDYIYDHLHTRITLNQLAAHVHLSPSYLSRTFKAETGISISEYIQNKKLETAKNMLEFSDYSISEIAAILAYPSHSYFSDIFRKSTQMTPQAYRTIRFRKLGI